MSITSNMKQRLEEKARLYRNPITVNLELLPVCNLDCAMCYIRSDWEEVQKIGGLKTADEWLAFAEQLLDAGTLFLLLTGGEVFLYPEFRRLYIGLYEMGFSIAINSNATMIDEKVMEWLAEYPPEYISISLYGSNDEVYEQLCRRKGMFTRVDHALDLLKANHITVELKTMITPYNLDDIGSCIRYARNKDLPYEATAYSFPAIRKLGEEEQTRFTPEETVDATFRLNEQLYTPEELDARMIDSIRVYENTQHRQGYVLKGLTCHACHSSCWITWQGRMCPCAMMPEPAVYPFETGFLNAWESLKKITDEITISPKCTNCDKREVCRVCPASACAEAGSPDAAPAYRCRMADYTVERMYRYAREHNLSY